MNRGHIVGMLLVVGLVIACRGYLFGSGSALDELEERRLRVMAFGAEELRQAARDGHLPTLRGLTLSHDNGNDADLAAVQGATNLEVIECNQCKQLPGLGLAAAAATPIVELSASGANGFTDEGLAAIGKLTTLHRLNIEGAWRVSDQGIAALGMLTGLQRLRLHGAGIRSGRVTGESLAAFSDLVKLEFLALGGMRLGGHGLALLAKLPALRDLDLMSTHLRDTDLAALPDFPVLQQLELMGNGDLTDNIVPGLERASHLTFVGLQGTGVTAAGVQKLASARPTLRIAHESTTAPGGFDQPEAVESHFRRYQRWLIGK